MRYLVEKS